MQMNILTKRLWWESACIAQVQEIALIGIEGQTPTPQFSVEIKCHQSVIKMLG